MIPDKAKADKHNPYSIIKKGSLSFRPALLVVVVTPEGIYEKCEQACSFVTWGCLTAAVVGSKDSDNVLGRITLLLSRVSSVGLSRYMAEGFYKKNREVLISLVKHPKHDSSVLSFSYRAFFIG
jgi:hypothetical protein